MELAPEKGLLERTGAFPRWLEVRASTDARKRTYMILALVALATALRLYGINTYPVFGDEYNSIAMAKEISLNWNSILYAVLTHFLIRLGDGEFWLRLPAMIFGVAAVPVLFRVGERLGGWRLAVTCGLLAAVSPFSIFHSQEIRFYSLFMLASATFLLATISYVDRPRSARGRLLLALAAAFLVLSHFLGILALCAQSTAALFANSRVSKRLRAVVLSGFVVLIVVPLIPFVQHTLWAFYSAHAAVTDFALPPFNGLSIINFAKLAFSLFTFAFGYHVYPLRVGFVVFGSAVFGCLFAVGLLRLWKTSAWRILPVTYLLGLIAVFFVLNSIGGSVSSVVGPRHVAFVWPVFVLITAMGLAAFRGKLFAALLSAVLMVSLGALWLGWQKDWSAGNVPDYRAAATYAGQWTDDQTALIIDGRLGDPFGFYFSTNKRAGRSYSYRAAQDSTALRRNRRLIMLSDEWWLERRQEIDRALRQINTNYTVVDGRVDYPLFEYVFERNPQPSSSSHTQQLQFPLTVYGVEFQDLKLPIKVKRESTQFKIIGASALPGVDDHTLISVALDQPNHMQQLILLSNVVSESLPSPGTVVADLLIEDRAGLVTTFPVRMGLETASWDRSCEPGAKCASAYQWHKRLAIVGQNSYPGAYRDFSAQIHSTSFNLPAFTDVAKVSIRYRTTGGHLYIWGVALNDGQL